MPDEGYVGAGEVTQEATPVGEFMVTDENGEEVPITEMDLDAEKMGEDADDLEYCEYLVGVDWEKTLDKEDAYWEKGMFSYRNIACRINQQHKETLENLYDRFDINETN